MATKGAILLLAFGFISAIHLSDAFLFNTCVHVRAAVRRGNVLDMFTNDHVISFNPHNRQFVSKSLVGSVYKQFPWLTYVQAAFHPIDRPSTIILIVGHYYLTYDVNGFQTKGLTLTKDIFPNHPTFQTGIDAAANYNGNVHFFKDCQMLIRRPNTGDEMVNMQQAGIPCNPRAAWGDTQGGLVVATEKKAVRLLGGGQISAGFCAFDNFHSQTNLCGCND